MPDTPASVVGRASALGALGGSVVAGLVAGVDVVRALSDAEFRAQYGTWSGMVVALPVGALVGLGCSLVAAVVHLGLRTRTRLPLRPLASLGAATPIVVLGALSLEASALVASLVLGAIAFGFAFLTFPLVVSGRSGARRQTGRVPG